MIGEAFMVVTFYLKTIMNVDFRGVAMNVDFRGVASRRQDEILIQICLFVFQTKNV